MTSTFTTNIGIEQPGLGDYPGSWSTPVNADWALIDQTFGSSTSVAFTNANVTLSVAQSAYFMIVCTGTLTANVQLILPAAIGGRRMIFNQTIGAFTLTVLNGASDTGGGVVVGQGFMTPVVLTAGRAFYDAYASTPPGMILDMAFTSPPPGFLLCYGQLVSRATYAQLWASATAYGWTWGNGDGSTTFQLPDCRGIVRAGADNMGGSAAGRLTGFTVGTSGGAQAITLSTAQIPAHSHTDAGHGHGVNDPSHTHSTNAQVGVSSGNIPAGPGIGLAAASVGGAFTGISIQAGAANIQNTGGGGSHSNVQPTAAFNTMIRY